MPETSQMKVAIVTGSSRGIGRAIARRLSADGMAVVLTGRDESALAQAAAETAPNSATIALDLRQPAAAAQLADFAIARFGRIDVLVNNAGATKRGDFLALTDDDWTDGFALKFFGAVRLTRAAWPHLKATCGSVVHISGIGGRTPGREFAIGGSVNAALLSFTKALAEQGIADGVQVNCINPGAIRTDRLQLRLQKMMQADAEQRFIQESGIVRVGEPEEIASLVSHILTQRFLHGSIIDIDGGQTKSL